MEPRNERQALLQVAARLRARLPNVSADAIDACVEAAYHEFDNARVRDYVEILVERSALEKVGHTVG